MALKVLSFGLSDYALMNKTIYADNDANGFTTAIKDFHTPALNQVYLNQQLGKSLMLRWTKEFANDLGKNDTCYFFYAGHGCNNKKNSYLSAFDTVKNDISTWVSLAELLDIIKASGCRKIICFIDACQEVLDSESRGEFLDQLDIKESFKIQDENHYELILFSSSLGERASVNDSEKHGIWSYYLIQAFRGNSVAKEAISDKGHLYLNRLQEFLHVKVKDYYRGIGKSPKQSSVIKGEMHIDPLLAIFPLAQIQKYEAVPPNAILKIRFETSVDKKVRNLEGFDKDKGHKVPKKYDDYTNRLIKRFGNSDINEIIEDDSEKIVEIFDLDPDADIDDGGYELSMANEDGVATFECKYFKYSVFIELDENDLENAIISLTLKPLDQDKLYQLSEDLDNCFTHWFDRMFMERSINPKTMYSKLKKSDSADYTVKYRPVDDEIVVTFKDGREFVITSSGVYINFKSSEPIHRMLESLTDLSNELMQIDSKIKLLN